MIGLVPCKLSSELHVNGRRVFRAKDKGVEREVLASDAGRSFKCSQVMSAEGPDCGSRLFSTDVHVGAATSTTSHFTPRGMSG
jgi:hypothetical protein